MGAGNAIAAFDLYAHRVPPMALLLLVRMALTSVDSHQDPYFEGGHDMLARAALGRGRHAALSDSDRRAVRRGISDLRAAGAIETLRHGAVRRGENDSARYGLNLTTASAADTGRKTSYVGRAEVVCEDPQHRTENVLREDPSHRTDSVRCEPSQDPPHRTFSAVDTGRFLTGTPDGKRPTKEERGGVKEEEKEHSALAKILKLPSAGWPVVNQSPAVIALVTDTRLPVVTAQTITADWVDHCRNHKVDLPPGLIGRYAKLIKSALDANFEPGLIKRALARMLSDGQASWPGSFDAYLVRVQEQPTGAPPRKLTPGEESAKRLVEGAENPSAVVSMIQQFFNKGAS